MEVVHSMAVAGTEKVVYDIVTKSPSDRFTFLVVCLDFIGKLGEDLIKKGIRLYCLHRRPGWDFLLLKRFSGIIEEEKPDIVHCHQYTPYFYGATASFFSRVRPRIIFTEHGRHQPDRRRWKRILYNKFLNRITSDITGVSLFTKRSLIKYEGFPSSRIRVIYNGIDTERFNLEMDKVKLRKKLGFAPDDVIVGHIARFCPVKDQRTLLMAMKIVIDSIQWVRLVLVGDGPMKKELELLADSLGISRNIHFLGRRDDIPELLSIFDVFVLSSISEALSITLLEAMVSGVPIVVTNVGGNPEVITDGQTGLLVPPKDPDRLAQAIIRLLKDNELGKRLGEMAKKKAIKEFSLERMIDNYIRLFGYE